MLDASGYGTSGTTAATMTGGTIRVTGGTTWVERALIDVSGRDGGGQLRLGGEYLGGQSIQPVPGLFVPNLATPNAQSTFVAADVLLRGNAIERGHGGQLITWSDGLTSFGGTIQARGGLASGNGGFAEVSGHGQLDFRGEADLLPQSTTGARGTLLLDPTDIVVSNFAPNDASVSANLRLWLDASDTTRVFLTYSTDSVPTTASGTIGTNTITTSADVSAALAVGARIRLTGAGAVTAASTLGANTYTIAAIAGTTITTVETLTSTYSAGTSFFRGLVSALNDRSAVGNNSTQATQANMPLWISNGQNNLGTIVFDGNTENLSTAGNIMPATTALTLFHAFQHGSQASFPSQGRQFGVGQLNYADNWDSSGGPTGVVNPSTSSGTNAINVLNYNGVNYSGFLNSVAGTPVAGSATTGSRWIGGGSFLNTVDPLNPTLYETVAYNAALSLNNQNLLEQYMASRWAITLTPPGTGGTEAARAMASDGYSVFHAPYLQRLSISANISLVATNSIVINDLTANSGTGILALAAGRSLTLTAGAGGITMVNTANTLRTNGGAIAMTSGGVLTIGQLDTTNAGGTPAGANVTLRSAGGIITTGTINSGTAGNVIVDSTNSGANPAGANINATFTDYTRLSTANAGTTGTLTVRQAGPWSINLATAFTPLSGLNTTFSTTAGAMTLTGTGTAAMPTGTLRSSGQALTLFSSSAMSAGTIDTTNAGGSPNGANITLRTPAQTINATLLTTGTVGNIILDSTNLSANPAGAAVTATVANYLRITSANAGTAGALTLAQPGAWSFDLSTAFTPLAANS
ncbi:MAG: hypothetical protein LW650_15615, partial [Planctomycetaceae bacterium]|nr:hypothetical protein [Planctomycetaceae bacterium]